MNRRKIEPRNTQNTRKSFLLVSLAPRKRGEGQGEGKISKLLTPALSSFGEEREKTLRRWTRIFCPQMTQKDAD